MKQHGITFLLLTLIAAFLLIPSVSVAQIATDSALDEIVRVYRTQAASWIAPLLQIAIAIFWSLVVIDWVLSFGKLALDGGDLGEFGSMLVNKMIYVGFGMFLLNNPGFMTSIVDGFRDSAIQAGGSGIQPSNIFDAALLLSTNIFSGFSIWNTNSYALALAAFIILVCFSIASAWLVLTLIEMYIVMFGGIVFLGFFGSMFTKDYAMRFLTYAVSVGVKLFVIQLLMSLTINIVHDFTTNMETGTDQILVMVGVSVVMMVLMMQLPGIIQSFIGGVSNINGMGGFKTAAAAGVGAYAGAKAGGKSALGGAMSVSEAAKLDDGGSSGQRSPAGRAGAVVGNLARAAGRDLAARTSGQRSGRYGTMSGRMAADMRSQRLGGSAGGGLGITGGGGQYPSFGGGASGGAGGRSPSFGGVNSAGTDNSSGETSDTNTSASTADSSSRWGGDDDPERSHYISSCPKPGDKPIVRSTDRGTRASASSAQTTGASESAGGPSGNAGNQSDTSSVSAETSSPQPDNKSISQSATAGHTGSSGSPASDEAARIGLFTEDAISENDAGNAPQRRKRTGGGSSASSTEGDAGTTDKPAPTQTQSSPASASSSSDYIMSSWSDDEVSMPPPVTEIDSDNSDVPADSRKKKRRRKPGRREETPS